MGTPPREGNSNCLKLEEVKYGGRTEGYVEMTNEYGCKTFVCGGRTVEYVGKTDGYYGKTDEADRSSVKWFVKTIKEEAKTKVVVSLTIVLA